MTQSACANGEFKYTKTTDVHFLLLPQLSQLPVTVICLLLRSHIMLVDLLGIITHHVSVRSSFVSSGKKSLLIDTHLLIKHLQKQTEEKNPTR